MKSDWCGSEGKLRDAKDCTNQVDELITTVTDELRTPVRLRHLAEALTCAFTTLGLDVASGRDEVFAALVLARIIEPTSKLDSLRMLAEAGIDSPSR